MGILNDKNIKSRYKCQNNSEISSSSNGDDGSKNYAHKNIERGRQTDTHMLIFTHKIPAISI